MSGRARDNRLVHFMPAGTSPRPGDVVTTVVTRAAPHHLIADGAPRTVRRAAGGDAWQARREQAGRPGPGQAPAAAAGQVLLGMPSRPRAAHTA
jgi:tRNA-2-methylthio-N6-dimethylallyladenosine synthase